MTRFGASGDEQERAFEAFARACSTRLLRAAYLLCGDRQLAEDLLQTTMLRTARRWPAARTSPEAYARAVLVNLARDGARRAQRRPDEVLGDGHEPAARERRAGADHAHLLAERGAVLAALAQLPQRQREVVVLRFYADLDVAATAAAIGASEGTVMSYTSRALTRLRTLLAEPVPAGAAATPSEVPR